MASSPHLLLFSTESGCVRGLLQNCTPRSKPAAFNFRTRRFPPFSGVGVSCFGLFVLLFVLLRLSSINNLNVYKSVLIVKDSGYHAPLSGYPCVSVCLFLTFEANQRPKKIKKRSNGRSASSSSNGSPIWRVVVGVSHPNDDAGLRSPCAQHRVVRSPRRTQ